MELAILQEELNVLKKERVLSVVNRKKYGWFVVLTGWCGGHHFYAERYKLGLLYLVFFLSSKETR